MSDSVSQVLFSTYSIHKHAAAAATSTWWVEFRPRPIRGKSGCSTSLGSHRRDLVGSCCRRNEMTERCLRSLTTGRSQVLHMSTYVDTLHQEEEDDDNQIAEAAMPTPTSIYTVYDTQYHVYVSAKKISYVFHGRDCQNQAGFSPIHTFAVRVFFSK